MSGKILFVDDEPAILDGYRRLLRGEYEIDTAAGGSLALEMLTKQSYAVVIADMRMPEMDGAQLLSKIAAEYPGTMRIMLTGNSDMQTAVRAVNEGAVFRFLTKPCDKEILRTTIQAALAQYRLSGLQQESLGTAAPPKTARKKTADPALVEIEEKVRKILAVKSVSIRQPSTAGAIYVGKTIWDGPNYIVQSVAGTVAIAHPKNLLDQIPEIGDNVKIEYNAGSASVTNIGG
ncbi:MAG TPA: response regulator [Terriglobales bacterium]|nr:response regulator [Terriglobales bacterium]